MSEKRKPTVEDLDPICSTLTRKGKQMKLHDIVRLKEEDKDRGVPAGCQGTIVDVHEGGFFTVEFSDENGDTIIDALMTEYREDQLELDTAF